MTMQNYPYPYQTYMVQPQQFSPQPQPAMSMQPYTPQYWNYFTNQNLKKRGSLDDLFRGPKLTDHDMKTDHLIKAPEEEELSDLVEVTEKDIMGEPPKPKMPKIKTQPMMPPPQAPPSMGGLRY